MNKGPEEKLGQRVLRDNKDPPAPQERLEQRVHREILVRPGSQVNKGPEEKLEQRVLEA